MSVAVAADICGGAVADGGAAVAAAAAAAVPAAGVLAPREFYSRAVGCKTVQDGARIKFERGTVHKQPQQHQLQQGKQQHQ